jgi:hypothetical protein
LFDALEAGGDTVELSILRGADERTIHPRARRPFSTMDR